LLVKTITDPAPSLFYIATTTAIPCCYVKIGVFKYIEIFQLKHYLKKVNSLVLLPALIEYCCRLIGCSSLLFLQCSKYKATGSINVQQGNVTGYMVVIKK